MPKARLRAALLAGAALAVTLAGAAIQPVWAQETQAPATPAPDAAQPGVTQTQADPNQVVARDNGIDVTRQQVIDSAAQLPREVQAQIDLLFPKLVERYITLVLLAEKGRSEKLNEDPALQKRVADYENELIGQAYFARVLDQQMTPEAIQAQYDQWVKENPPKEEVHARHILVATEEEAKAIIEQLNGGASFEALAKEKSTDKGSGADGGDLKWFTKEVMVKEFADAAFAMKAGEISQTPVKSQFGYHIIKVEERRMQAVPTLDEKRNEIESDLVLKIQQSIIQDLRKGATVEILGPDGKPLPQEQPAQ